MQNKTKPVYKLTAPEPPGPDSPEYEAYCHWLLENFLFLLKLQKEGAGNKQLTETKEVI